MMAALTRLCKSRSAVFLSSELQDGCLATRPKTDHQPKYEERPAGRSSRIESLLLLRLRLLPGVGRIQLLLITLLLLLHILQLQQQLLRSLRAVRLVAIVRCWLEDSGAVAVGAAEYATTTTAL